MSHKMLRPFIVKVCVVGYIPLCMIYLCIIEMPSLKLIFIHIFEVLYIFNLFAVHSNRSWC